MRPLVVPRAAMVRQTLAVIGLTAAPLFLSAGRLGIPAFWCYVAILAAAFVAGLFVVDPDLAQERTRPGGQPLGARYLALSLLPIAHWVAAGLDRGRLHWSDTVPVELQAAGFVAFALAWAFVLWTMHVNRFFSSVARIQHERGHYVITSGPYRWIRHPGYAAAIVLVAASGIALGSWLATAIAALGIPLILWRAVGEDRLLLAQLPGYPDYARRVRYRLLPGVW
jgi:protein-S-isoprenylcysteine O-methyltransferase Ste14